MLINKLKNWSISALLLAVVAGCGGGSGGNKSSTTQPAIAEATKVIHAATAQPVPVAADYQNAVQELYVAYFGRPADATGLVNFENALLAANAPTDIQGDLLWSALTGRFSVRRRSTYGKASVGFF